MTPHWVCAVVGPIVVVASAWALTGCTSASAVLPPARALTSDERDPAPLRAQPDEFVVDGLDIDTRVVPRIDVAIGASGVVLAAWLDGAAGLSQQVVAALVAPGPRRVAALASLRENILRDVHVGFGADGSAVVAWDGPHRSEEAGVCVLPAGATEWSSIRSFGAAGAEPVALDPADAGRIAIVGTQRAVRWRLFLDPLTYVPLLDKDPVIGPETTVGAVDADGGVRQESLRPGTKGIARSGRWIAGRTRGSPKDTQRVVFVRDVETGGEAVLETDGRFDDVGCVECGGVPVVAWGGSTGLVVCERGADGWMRPVQVVPTFVGDLGVAASGQDLLVTMSAGGDVRAWLRRGGRWSGPARWSGWSGVPAFDRGKPVVFRVIDSTGASASAPNGSPIPASGTIVRSAIE
jgi:hypothetical protein